MKNVLSTLAVLAILGTGIGFLCYSAGLFETEVQVDPEDVATEIEQKLGEPFLKAVAERDVKTLKSFIRGDFGAAILGPTEWETSNQVPFDIQQRFIDEEGQDSTEIPDELLGALLDQTFGIEVGQGEFSIVGVPDYSRHGWTCQLLLRVTGVDENSHVRTYESEIEILVNMNHDMPGSRPSIEWWGFQSELKRQSTGPIMKELEPFLGQPTEASQPAGFALDVADFDQDQDLDIVLMLEDGRQLLFAWTNGKYENVSDSMGLSSFGANPNGAVSVTFLDVDQDGFPELVSENRLFRNEQGKNFVEVDSPSELKLDGADLGAYRRRIRQ